MCVRVCGCAPFYESRCLIIYTGLTRVFKYIPRYVYDLCNMLVEVLSKTKQMGIIMKIL